MWLFFPGWSNGHLAFFMCQAFPIPTFPAEVGTEIVAML